MSQISMSRRQFLSTGAASFAAAPLAALAAPPQFETSNAKIQQDRQTALDLLSPSRRDLEHGLELHAGAIVFDSYGFAPRAAYDADVLNKAAEAGATEIEIDDLREEMGIRDRTLANLRTLVEARLQRA